jgi:hypothetical protein
MTQELPPIFLKVIKATVEDNSNTDKNIYDIVTTIVNILATSHKDEFLKYLKEVPVPENAQPTTVLVQQIADAVEHVHKNPETAKDR